MDSRVRVTAIVGSYRKGGTVDRAVDEVLAAAGERGAETAKIHLMDRHIEFCTNCRTCTQEEGEGRGECPIADEMERILAQVEESDAIVLASPMNFGSATAVMKRFMERLACFAYWPWGTHAPKMRSPRQGKRAVLVASSAAPAPLARLMSRMVGQLKTVAKVLGARSVGVLFIGLAAGRPEQELTERTRRAARRLGERLVQGG